MKRLKFDVLFPFIGNPIQTIEILLLDGIVDHPFDCHIGVLNAMGFELLQDVNGLHYWLLIIKSQSSNLWDLVFSEEFLSVLDILFLFLLLFALHDILLFAVFFFIDFINFLFEIVHDHLSFEFFLQLPELLFVSKTLIVSFGEQVYFFLQGF